MDHEDHSRTPRNCNINSVEARSHVQSVVAFPVPNMKAERTVKPLLAHNFDGSPSCNVML